MPTPSLFVVFLFVPLLADVGGEAVADQVQHVVHLLWWFCWGSVGERFRSTGRGPPTSAPAETPHRSLLVVFLFVPLFADVGRKGVTEQVKHFFTSFEVRSL